MTFLEARSIILDFLAAGGWSVKPNLKIPHATSPSGEFRLWFKPQALHYSVGRMHEMGGARSTFLDMKEIVHEPIAFLSTLKTIAQREGFTL